MKKLLIAALLISMNALSPGMAHSMVNPEIEILKTYLIVKTKLVDEKIIELRIANLQEKYTEISLTDLKGDFIFYSEGVNKTNTYQKAFNIKNLADGKYLLQIENDGEVLQQVIKVTGDHIFLSDIN